ncbi:lymphotoxin-beta isoform X2 [Pseudophryne corroboree]|uniref:lymphotoxin-beta isoform X2 n=1 Tax=Pseudophryne corroboree TaxID=495146 RepID=UPI00308166A0
MRALGSKPICREVEQRFLETPIDKMCEMGRHSSIEADKRPALKANQKNNWQKQNIKKPAAHLIATALHYSTPQQKGKDFPDTERCSTVQMQYNNNIYSVIWGVQPSQSNTMKWISESDVAFTRKVTHLNDTTLVTPRKGIYYVYCQVGFGGTNTNLRLSSEVITWSESFNANVTLLVGSETISGPPLGHKLWRTSLNQGGLANLRAGQKLYVHISHPELVDYTEGKTFFGLVMVS